MVFRVILYLFLFTATAYSRPVSPPTTRTAAPDVTIAVSADGQTVAIARSSGGGAKRYGRIELWNTRRGELLRTITGFDGPIWSMTFSNDAKSLITISTEYRDSKIQSSVTRPSETVRAELKWWDTQSGEFVKRLPLGEEGIWKVEASWSPTGNLLALVEHYSHGHYADIEDPGALTQRRVIQRWVNVQEIYLRLLDAQSGERRVKVEKGDQSYSDQVTYLGRMAHPVFTKDGKLLAAVSGDDVHVWNVESGKRLWTIGKLKGIPKAIAFSPDGRLIAVAAAKSRWLPTDSDITLREISTGREVNRLRGRNDAISCLRFILDGRALLIGSLQYSAAVAMGTVKFWDLRENRIGKYDVLEGKAVSSLVHLPDQRAVILQSGTEVEIREVKTWRVLHTFEPPDDDERERTRHSRFLVSPNHAEAVGFSSDGMTVSAALPGEGIRSWDRRTGGVRNRIPRQASDEVIAASSSGEFIVEATAEEVRLVNLVSGVHTVVPLRMPNRFSAIGLSRDGRSLVTADDVGDIRIWDLNSGQLKETFETGQEITAVAIDPSGQLLAAARADHSIGLWNVATGPLQVELRKHQDVVNALAFSPDGKTIASGGDDRTAILWEVATAKVKRTLKGHDFTVTSLAFSPDGLLLASGSGNASVVLWKVTTGKVERILR
jgi:WD40 repeat protein